MAASIAVAVGNEILRLCVFQCNRQSTSIIILKWGHRTRIDVKARKNKNSTINVLSMYELFEVSKKPSNNRVRIRLLIML